MSMFELTPELKAKLKPDKEEVRYLREIAKVVKDKFNELSEDIACHTINRRPANNTVQIELDKQAEVDKVEKFVVISNSLSSGSADCIRNDDMWNSRQINSVGNFLGINEKGKFESGHYKLKGGYDYILHATGQIPNHDVLRIDVILESNEIDIEKVLQTYSIDEILAVINKKLQDTNDIQIVPKKANSSAIEGLLRRTLGK